MIEEYGRDIPYKFSDVRILDKLGNVGSVDIVGV